MSQERMIGDMAARMGVADEELVEVWQALTGVINRHLAKVTDSGIGLGAGDIGFTYKGVRCAVTIKVLQEKVEH